MKIGQFIAINQTTRDTIRYYIEEGLLAPTKEAGNYIFGNQEQDDFTNIKELQALGFSIKGIKEIKDNRQILGCGSQEQSSKNRKLVVKELERINVELTQLAIRQEKLEKILRQLNTKETLTQ